MKTISADLKLRALVAAREPASTLMDTLSRRGISTTVVADADEALRECRMNPPHLVIVAGLDGMTEIGFLRELLKISWKTFTILVADEDEEVLHDQTEGLGILGSIRRADDTEGLDNLLDKFVKMVSAEQP
jgi:hypothetical protein